MSRNEYAARKRGLFNSKDDFLCNIILISNSGQQNQIEKTREIVWLSNWGNSQRVVMQLWSQRRSSRNSTVKMRKMEAIRRFKKRRANQDLALKANQVKKRTKKNQVRAHLLWAPLRSLFRNRQSNLKSIMCWRHSKRWNHSSNRPVKSQRRKTQANSRSIILSCIRMTSSNFWTMKGSSKQSTKSLSKNFPIYWVPSNSSKREISRSQKI